MPLSISKLEKLLNDNGFHIRTIFAVSHQATHIELFNARNAESCFLYIPSKYEIEVRDSSRAFEISYVEENEILKVEPERDVARDYNKLEAYLSADAVLPSDVEESLKDGYATEELMKDSNSSEMKDLRVLHDQMQRLKLCVKNLKYKLVLMLREVMCVVRRDDTLDYFQIKSYKSSNSKRLLVVMDLENFFTNPQASAQDVASVKNGVYRIMTENQFRHTRVVTALLERKTDVTTSSEAVYRTKEGIDRMIAKLEQLLERVSQTEIFKIESIDEARNRSVLNPGIHGEIGRSQEIFKCEKELQGVTNLKQEIVRELVALRSQQASLALEMDGILYQNAVYIDKIAINFKKLNTLVGKIDK